MAWQRQMGLHCCRCVLTVLFNPRLVVPCRAVPAELQGLPQPRGGSGAERFDEEMVKAEVGPGADGKADSQRGAAVHCSASLAHICEQPDTQAAAA